MTNRNKNITTIPQKPKVKRTTTYDKVTVHELDDLDMTLGELHGHIAKLISIYGIEANISTNAGYSNVSFEIKMPDVTEIIELPEPGPDLT